MRVLGLYSVSIRVRQFDEAVQFYRDVLGLEPRSHIPERFTRLRCGPGYLEIGAVLPGEPAGPPQHFGFTVAGGSLRPVLAFLKTQGFEPIAAAHDPAVNRIDPAESAAFVTDPSGHLVGFFTSPEAPVRDAADPAPGLEVLGLARVSLAARDMDRMSGFLTGKLGLRRIAVERGREIYAAGEATVALVEAGQPWLPGGAPARPWPARCALLIEGKRGNFESPEGHWVDLLPGE